MGIHIPIYTLLQIFLFDASEMFFQMNYFQTHFKGTKGKRQG